MRPPVVKLLVTGRMEHKALHLALNNWVGQQFGLHDCIKNALHDTVNGFTSAPLPSTTHQTVPGQANLPMVTHFAADLIQHALNCGSNEYLMAVEDTEHVGAPHASLALLRSELIRQSTQLTIKEQARLQNRASFHFAMPMIESWLFPDSNALHIAGSQHGQGQWNPASDAEQFQVADPVYTQWRQLAQSGCKARSTLNFDQHPKHYLRFMSRDATDHPQYKETRQGAKALAALDWSKVPQPSPHMACLHALLDDLSDMLGATYPHAVPSGTVTQRRSGGVLRNL